MFRRTRATATRTANRINKSRRFSSFSLQYLEDRTVPATIVVTNNLDDINVDGTISIREALASINGGANINADVSASGYGTADAIDLTGISGTINLTAANGANLTISKAVTITGPGAGTLTIANTAAASTTSRVFLDNNPTSGAAGLVTISGMTVTGGNVSGTTLSVSGGGGIHVSTNTNLTLNNVTVTGNSTTSEGGGVSNYSTGVLTLNNCTISNNKATGGDGGGINNQATSSAVAITNSTISGNSSSSDGGGIYMNNSSTLTMNGSTISGNTAAATSGGIYLFGSAGVWNINTSTITLNKANGGNGGGIRLNSGVLTVTNSLFTSNSASASGGALNNQGGTFNFSGTTFDSNAATTSGGAINQSSGTGNLFGAVGTAGNTISNNSSALGGGLNMSGGTVTIRNATIAKNTATGATGGGGFNLAGATVNLQNTTVAINAATGAGATGGGFRRTSGTLNLGSSIIANNTSTTGGADGHSTVAAGVTITLNNSLIGSDIAGDNITYNGTGQTNVASGLDTGTGLALNGAPAGTPLTIALLPGSLSINTGNNLQLLTTDARGPGFPRQQGIGTDVGAFETPDPAPTATGTSPNVTTVGGTTQTVTVVYTDANGSQLIDRSTIGVGTDITVNGPGGFTVNPAFVSADSAVDAKTITATYSFTPPGGYWNFPDNGSYTITMNANEVLDKDGVANPVPAGNIGLFTVNTPTNIPAAVGSSTAVTAAGGTLQSVTVKFTDDIGIDVSTLTNGDITINGPGGFTTGVTYVSVDVNSNGTPRSATYTFTPPGGSWDGADNGSYTISMNGSEVFDIDTPTPNAVPAAANIGTFAVGVPFSFVVNATNDEAVDSDGKMSLREAILAANAKTGTNDVITFDAGVFATSQTIVLTVGELAPSESVVINAPAAASARVTVDGNALSRIFNIGGGTLTISNLTMTNGKSASGGGIQANANSVTLTNCTISNCVSTGTTQGGGISTGTGTGTWTLVDTTLSGNSGARGGAVYFFTSGTLRMSGCTVTGNSASDANGGGGLYNYSNSAVIINSTFHNNKATTGKGGGIEIHNSGAVSVFNSTITGNTAGTTGGGINRYGTGTLTLVSTIVAENSATTGPDINGAVGTALFNLVGKTDGSSGITDPSNKTGTIATPLNPGLTALGNNGGPTQTRGIAAGSIALNNGASAVASLSANVAVGDTSITVTNSGALVPGSLIQIDAEILQVTSVVSGTVAGVARAQQGSTAAAHTSGTVIPLAYDQRGPGFPRQIGASVDIGSVETIPAASTPPSGTATAPNINVAGGTVNTITVVYTDAETNIDVSKLDNNDLQITGPGGPYGVVFKSSTPAGLSVTATYEVTAPGGTYDFTDNGTYNINVVAAEVFDSDAPPQSVPAGKIGSFTVSLAGNYVVNATNDESVDSDGKTSLREAILASNGTVGLTDTITFDATVFATPQTITLALGQLSISDAVIVTGPAVGVTVDAAGLSRVMSVDATGSGNSISISNMTMTNGNSASNGGGILNNDEALTLTNCSVSGNTTSADGGGISITATAGSLTMVGCTVSNNKATSTTSQGGGIHLASGSTVSVDRSTVSGNEAGEDGGGFYFFFNGALTVTNSTISGNKADLAAAGVGGGGIYFYGTATTFVLTNCTLSGNTANNAGTYGYGGAILTNSFVGTMVLRNSTIAFNDAGAGGGGVANTGAGTFDSTIIAGNTIAGANAPTADVFFIAPTVVAGDNNLIGIQDAGTNATFGALTQTGSVATPLDAKLGALALNGAPAGSPFTHALLPGSPALNKGNNVAALSFDERGTGFNRVVGISADVGAFEVQTVANPPTVTSVSVNGGGIQRSMVTSLVVTFSEAVTLPGSPETAFTLTRIGQPTGGPQSGAPLGTVNVVAMQVGNVVTLTFVNGGAVPIDLAGSLLDGTYQLTIDASKVTGVGGQLDGNGDLTGGDNYLTPGLGDPNRITRLYGDADGNFLVDGLDFGAFRSAFNTASATFDYDGSGIVDGADFGTFRSRFNVGVP